MVVYLVGAQEWIDKPLEEKRTHYKCGRRYKTLKDIPTWASDERRGGLCCVKWTISVNIYCTWASVYRTSLLADVMKMI